MTTLGRVALIAFFSGMTACSVSVVLDEIQETQRVIAGNDDKGGTRRPVHAYVEWRTTPVNGAPSELRCMFSYSITLGPKETTGDYREVPAQACRGLK